MLRGGVGDGEARLLRVLLRHLHRRALRRPVPAARRPDGARRRRRPVDQRRSRRSLGATRRRFGARCKTYLADCLTAHRAARSPAARRRGDRPRSPTLLCAPRQSPHPRRRRPRGRTAPCCAPRSSPAVRRQRAWADLTQAFTAVLRGRRRPTLQQLADAYDGPQAHGVHRQPLRGDLRRQLPRQAGRRRIPRRSRQQGAQLDAADPLRAADNAEDLGDPVCANWPVPVDGSVRARAPRTGSPPILVLGTTGDPATPYAWAQSLAGQLPGGVLLTLRGRGAHGVPQPACRA